MPIRRLGLDQTHIERGQMNRRTCINCQTAWNSLADHELESPHTCPRCGDELTPIHQPQSEGEVGLTRSFERP